MLETFAAIYTGIFSALGLASPLKRFLFGTAAGFSAQLLLKPSIAYDKRSGNAKAFLSETLFPWYLISILPGIVFALFF